MKIIKLLYATALLTLASLHSIGQIAELRIKLSDKEFNEPLTMKDFTLIINDTLEYAMKTDDTGLSNKIKLTPKKYKLCIRVPQYNDFIVKNRRLYSDRTEYINAELTPPKKRKHNPLRID